LTGPAVDKFDPDAAIQEWLKGRKCKRRPGFMDSEPKLKRARLCWRGGRSGKGRCNPKL